MMAEVRKCNCGSTMAKETVQISNMGSKKIWRCSHCGRCEKTKSKEV